MDKAQIREQADALFSRISFAKTSVADIAKACGLGKGTIYLYYKSKDDIVLDIIEERIARLVEIDAAFFGDKAVPLRDKVLHFSDGLVDEAFALKDLLFGPFENVKGDILKNVFFKYGRFYDWCIEHFADIVRPYSTYADKDAELFDANAKTFMELMIGRIVLHLVGGDWNDREGLKSVMRPLSVRLFNSLVEQEA
jgi:AcrR family transcriptional regulator